MFDKIFDVFRKVDRTISTIDSMQRTADRVEYQTQRAAEIKSNKVKWFILVVIIIVAILYALFG